MEVAPVLEISGAEEGSPEPSICKHPLRDRLSDGALPRACESIQPVYRGPVGVACPEFHLVQDSPAGPLETMITIAMSVLGLLSTAEIVDDSRFGCRRNRVRHPPMKIRKQKDP